MSDINIKISQNGEIAFVWDDALVDLRQAGTAVVTRASDVEPEGEGWTADLSRIGGGRLGPFLKRSEALSAEKAEVERIMGIPGVLPCPP